MQDSPHWRIRLLPREVIELRWGRGTNVPMIHCACSAITRNKGKRTLRLRNKYFGRYCKTFTDYISLEIDDIIYMNKSARFLLELGQEKAGGVMGHNDLFNLMANEG